MRVVRVTSAVHAREANRNEMLEYGCCWQTMDAAGRNKSGVFSVGRPNITPSRYIHTPLYNAMSPSATPARRQTMAFAVQVRVSQYGNPDVEPSIHASKAGDYVGSRTMSSAPLNLRHRINTFASTGFRQRC